MNRQAKMKANLFWFVCCVEKKNHYHHKAVINMSYYVALIQNESEMLRYSHADIRPTLKKYNYEWSYYTAENIDSLFANILRYDAIVLATNACNDEIVLDSLTKHKDAIASFLDTPRKGMLVMFQMKLTDQKYNGYPFLPDKFGVKGHYRFSSNETASDGHLVSETTSINHVILNHPHRIDIGRIKLHCLTNTNTPGLYWGYLSTSTNNMEVIIKDDSYENERPLLLVSPEDAKARLVISSLVLDWQLHDLLWENTLRFVVEGRHLVGIVTKRDNVSFDLEYLRAVLSAQKIPYNIYSQRNINLSQIPLTVHTVLIFDPLFTRIEIKSAIEPIKSIVQKIPNLFFFEPWIDHDSVLSAVSHTRDFDIVAKNSIAWLTSLYQDGFWEGSFWRTVDILGTLYYFNEPIKAYKNSILKSISKKRTITGTYDNVFGATCAMLLIHYWFEDITSKEFNETLSWLLSNLTKVDLFNQATAIETIVTVAPDMVDDFMRSELRSKIISRLEDFNNLLELQRFATSLLECGFLLEAHEVIKRLLILQEQVGDTNLYSIAEITFVLIRILAASEGLDNEIQNHIFKNIQFLRENYDTKTFSWKNNAITTAKSLKALKAFENMIAFPVDDLVASLTEFEYRDVHYVAIEMASKANRDLLNKLYKIEQKSEEATAKTQEDIKHIQLALEDEIKQTRSARTTILILLPTAYLLFILSGYLGLIHLQILQPAVEFLSKWQDLLSTIVVTTIIVTPLLVYIYLIGKFRMLPKFLVNFLRQAFNFDLEKQD